MFRFNRRPYIVNRQCQKNLIEAKKTVVTEESPAKTADNPEDLSKSLNELKEFMRKLQESLDFLDLRQKKLESDIERLNSKFRIMEMLNMRNDLEADQTSNSNSSDVSYADMNKPVMPGSGFSGVTANYLRGLRNK